MLYQRVPSFPCAVTGDTTVCRCGAGCLAYIDYQEVNVGEARGVECSPEGAESLSWRDG